MIYPDRFGNFLKQDRLAHSRRRDNKAALSPTEGRQQINRSGADGICLWIFQHDPALRKLRCEFVEVRQLGPLLRRLSLDGSDLLKREKFLSMLW
jgi:hypothetical protein